MVYIVCLAHFLEKGAAVEWRLAAEKNDRSGRFQGCERAREDLPGSFRNCCYFSFIGLAFIGVAAPSELPMSATFFQLPSGCFI